MFPPGCSFFSEQDRSAGRGPDAPAGEPMRVSLPARLTVFALLALVLVAVFTATAEASPRGGRAATATATKTVRYHGYRLVVPRSWPVFNLATDPTVCVRFNRHAVYLGRPGSRQRCPAHAVGRTEALLVEPLSAHSARSDGATGPALAPVGNPRAQPPHGSATERAVPTAGVVVTATWDSDPGGVAPALGGRS